MIEKVKTVEIHTREHRAVIDHKLLERIVASFVAENVPGLAIDLPGVRFTVSFEEKTEGSPGYRVGTNAVVKITEDLTTRDLATQEQEV